jgi:hypothetical protein
VDTGIPDIVPEGALSLGWYPQQENPLHRGVRGRRRYGSSVLCAEASWATGVAGNGHAELLQSTLPPVLLAAAWVSSRTPISGGPRLSFRNSGAGTGVQMAAEDKAAHML